MAAPAFGQGQAQPFGLGQQPDQRHIGQRPGGFLPAKLTAHVGVAAAEPHLLDPAVGVVPPQDRREGDAGFVQGQGMDAMFHVRGQPALGIGKIRLGQGPQEGQAQAQRHDRVQKPDHADRHMIMAARRVEPLARAVAIDVPGTKHGVAGGLVGRQQADARDHVGQGADPDPAARIAEQIKPVAGPPGLRQPAVGGADVAVQRRARHQFRHRPPSRPLLARRVMQQHLAARWAHVARQHPVDPRDRGTPSFGQRGEGAIHQDNQGAGWGAVFHGLILERKYE